MLVINHRLYVCCLVDKVIQASGVQYVRSDETLWQMWSELNVTKTDLRREESRIEKLEKLVSAHFQKNDRLVQIVDDLQTLHLKILPISYSYS